MDSPLLFPVYMKDDVVYVLDETRIPFKEEFIEVRSFSEACEVLASMKTRSLGQVLLFLYTCACFAPVDEVVRRFKERRPTFDFPLLGEMVKSFSPGALRAGVAAFIQQFDMMRRKRAATLAEVLPSPARILTLCNVNGELLYLSEALAERGKEMMFYVSETRPYLQGTRLTFWELKKNGIPCRLFCDAQAAVLMREGEVNCVVTGADRATVKGDVINKIGTYALARLASHFKIPFYPLVQYPRDIDVNTVEIEQRPSSETFLYVRGVSSLPDSVYPAFDVTPHEFVSRPIELGK
jgi:methylthioribose-1-phosphate isomerase